MEEHVYRVIELVGTSETSIEDAVKTAVARASKTINYIRWAEVMQTRCHIENGEVAHFQVVMKVGFTLEDQGPTPKGA